MDVALVTLIGLVMAVGLFGTLLPLLPGLPIIWAAALVYGLAEGFDGAGLVSFVLITLLAVVGIIAGFVLPHRRVAAKGAPASTVAAGVRPRHRRLLRDSRHRPCAGSGWGSSARRASSHRRLGDGLDDDQGSSSGLRNRRRCRVRRGTRDDPVLGRLGSNDLISQACRHG